MARDGQPLRPATVYDNARGTALILGVALVCVPVYGLLAGSGDLNAHWTRYLLAHLLLSAAAGVAWAIWRGSPGPGRTRQVVLGAALAFRLVAALGQPALSDDVYRYVWDGRVSLHGTSPYRHAPADEALAPLRDEAWTRINHPELRTVYPPLAQVLFAVLAALGAGQLGFRVALGLLDFAVVLALERLLRVRRLPPQRLLLYAWNPLAVLETAGSGHVEPLGVLLLLLGLERLGRGAAGGRVAALTLAGAIQTKILPVVLIPAWTRRVRPVHAALLCVLLLLPLALFALPAAEHGTGLGDYATRWERNALVFPLVRDALEGLDTGERLKSWVRAAHGRAPDADWVPWDLLYRGVWPPYVARAVVASMALLWLTLLWRRRLDDPLRESLHALGGVLLLSPTLHPWYLLWVLPLAAALGSVGWLALGLLAPLAYLGGDGDVPWPARALEYGLPLTLLLAGLLWRRRSR